MMATNETNSRPRILLIAYEYPPLGGGVAKVAKNTARMLHQFGYAPVILTSKFQHLPTEDSDNGVAVFRIPVLRRYLNYANAIEVASFAASGILHNKRLLKKIQPALCISYLTIPSGIVACDIRRRQNIPYVNLLLGQDVPGHPEPPAWLHKLAWPATRRVWRNALHIAANSQGLADLARRSAGSLPIPVVHTGVDTALFSQATSKQPAKSKPLRVLYVGRLVACKRIDALFHAWAVILQSVGRPLELRLAGFGPEREKLEALSQSLGLESSVRFLGRLDEDQVVRAYREANIFVNLSEMEGLPNSVIEAMSCELPCVLSDIAPHRELAFRNPDDEPAALLCDENSTQSVAEAILRLVGAPELRETLGRRARKTIVENFSWEAVTRQLVALFPEELRLDPPAGETTDELKRDSARCP